LVETSTVAFALFADSIDLPYRIFIDRIKQAEVFIQRPTYETWWRQILLRLNQFGLGALP